MATTPTTELSHAQEDLGLALGRACAADREFLESLLRGLARAGGAEAARCADAIRQLGHATDVLARVVGHRPANGHYATPTVSSARARRRRGKRRP